MSAWASFIEACGRILATFGGILLGFFTRAKIEETKAAKEALNETEKQLELNLETQRRQRDDAERSRVRERFRDRG